MKEVITPENTRLFAEQRIEENVRHDFVVNRKVPVATSDIPRGAPFDLGCEFHDLLYRIADRKALSARERKFLPWLVTCRDALRENGAGYLEPEVEMEAGRNLPKGRCDLIAHGGPAELGVIEVKVVNTLPDEPSDAHLLQMSGYAVLAEEVYAKRRIWAALAYVSLRERRVRLFCHKGTRRLRGISRHLIAA